MPIRQETLISLTNSALDLLNQIRTFSAYLEDDIIGKDIRVDDGNGGTTIVNYGQLDLVQKQINAAIYAGEITQDSTSFAIITKLIYIIEDLICSKHRELLSSVTTKHFATIERWRQHYELRQKHNLYTRRWRDRKHGRTTQVDELTDREPQTISVDYEAIAQITPAQIQMREFHDAPPNKDIMIRNLETYSYQYDVLEFPKNYPEEERDKLQTTNQQEIQARVDRIRQQLADQFGMSDAELDEIEINASGKADPNAEALKSPTRRHNL